MTRVAVLDDYIGCAEEFGDWAALGDDADVTFYREAIAPERMTEELADYEIIAITQQRARFPRAVLEALPRLQLIVTNGPTSNVVDHECRRERGILLCGTADTGPPTGDAESTKVSGISPTAEMAWALSFAVTKRMGIEDRAIRMGGWQTGFPVPLSGLTLGLAGLGRLGSQMVGLARGLGMEVIAWSENPTDERTTELGIRRVPRRISSASRTCSSYFLPFEHPLRTMENAVLMPHLGYVTEAGFRRSFVCMAEDVVAFAKGQPIRVVE